MPKATTPSFIHEMPLKVSPYEETILRKRLDAGRQLYNACLSQCLKQIKLIRDSKTWQKARKLYKSSRSKSEATKLFKQVIEEYSFREFELHKYASKVSKSCFIGEHLDSSTIQKVATRAFKSCEPYYYGKRGKPRFKPYNRFRSIEGKSNIAGIRFKDSKVKWNIVGGTKLTLSPIYDLKDKDGVEAHALSCKTKYVRILNKQIRGKTYWYVQLTLSGNSKQKAKHDIKKGVVGLDIGPSTIAVVSGEDAQLSGFCETLESHQNKIGAISRKMARSRYLTNKEHYNSDGTIKEGPKKWHLSKRYLQLKAKHQEAHRKMAATRSRLHGEYINQLLGFGDYFKTEKLSYSSFQKNYGKSVGFRAPGLFVKMLKRKAERAGGKVLEFSTYKTKLSQTCHCTRQRKKKLSERWHSCECGVHAQRDMYSAYLAIFVNEESKLDTIQASKSWTVAESLLGRVVSSLEQRTSGKLCFSSFGLNLNKRQSPSHVKGKSDQTEAADVVG